MSSGLVVIGAIHSLGCGILACACVGLVFGTQKLSSSIEFWMCLLSMAFGVSSNTFTWISIATAQLVVAWIGLCITVLSILVRLATSITLTITIISCAGDPACDSTFTCDGVPSPPPTTYSGPRGRFTAALAINALMILVDCAAAFACFSSTQGPKKRRSPIDSEMSSTGGDSIGDGDDDDLGDGGYPRYARSNVRQIRDQDSRKFPELSEDARAGKIVSMEAKEANNGLRANFPPPTLRSQSQQVPQVSMRVNQSASQFLFSKK